MGAKASVSWGKKRERGGGVGKTRGVWGVEGGSFFGGQGPGVRGRDRREKGGGVGCGQVPELNNPELRGTGKDNSKGGGGEYD